MANCIVVVPLDLPKRTEAQAIKGATGTAPTYRDLGTKSLIRKNYLNGESGTGGVYPCQRLADLSKCFGVRPRLTWYDTHVTVDNRNNETRVNGKALAEA